MLAYAADGSLAAAGDGSRTNTGDGSITNRLVNPLRIEGIAELFKLLVDVLMVFAIPIIVFFIIYAGFQYVMARGNPDAISKAHKALLYAVIGGVLILGAQTILFVISGTIDEISRPL